MERIIEALTTLQKEHEAALAQERHRLQELKRIFDLLLAEPSFQSLPCYEGFKQIYQPLVQDRLDGHRPVSLAPHPATVPRPKPVLPSPALFDSARSDDELRSQLIGLAGRRPSRAKVAPEARPKFSFDPAPKP